MTKFISTRGSQKNRPNEVVFSEAILNPLASYGGLYSPAKLPKLDKNFVQEFHNKSFKKLTKFIITKFDIDIEKADIEEAVALYDKFDDASNPAPIVKIDENLYSCELYHGPTGAFKDMAIQPFGFILSALAKRKNQKYIILVATSGDTGPSALHSFQNKENIKVVCLYPAGGTSDVQRLQMTTMSGKNLKVLGIKGTFDDAQTALKRLLECDDFKKRLSKTSTSLSAANSVNFGRILFQIVYHIYSYLQLVKTNQITKDEYIDICIPSGNFGNAVGAYYAKKMGLNIDNILVASNQNNILTQFINDGIYDIRDKKLIQTTSPAMDILKSSNIERVLFDMFGCDRTKELMENLNKNNIFVLTSDEKQQIQKVFKATCCDDEFAKQTIKNYFDDGYLMDPHTATCIKAYQEFKTDKKIVLSSTAVWSKFSTTVLNAIQNDDIAYSDKEAIDIISSIIKNKTNMAIKQLWQKEIIHKDIIEKEDIDKHIIKFV
ncbi:MAG: threonine synthase [Epsilonproteobacteria bacterium]|nr:MAG: threonine synthase [Campylobacterota bacterium]